MIMVVKVKKIVLFLIMLSFPILVSADNNYKVVKHYIDSEIEISGNLRVKELLIVDGEIDYLLRTLNYNSFGGKWDGKTINLENGEIYNALNIYNFACSAYKYNNEEININDLGKDVTYFKELDPKKVSDKTFNIKTKDGENDYYIYYQSSGLTAFYLEYVIGNAVVSHNDIKELNYIFKNLNYAPKTTLLRVLIPYPTSDESYHAFLHGAKGGYEDIEKDGQKYGIVAVYENLKGSPNVRITMPLDQVPIDINTNKSNIDALDKIIEIEDKLSVNSQKGKTINKYAKLVLISLSILYVLVGIYIYKNSNKVLLLIYTVLGLLLCLFNYLFKTEIYYIYLVILAPILLFIINKIKERKN